MLTLRQRDTTPRVALGCAALLFVVLAGCDLDTREAATVEQSDAVKGGSRGWKPSSAAADEKATSKPDAAVSQTAASAAKDAAAKDAEVTREDDVDAGAPPKPVNTKPMPAAGSGACATGRSEICNTIDDDCDKKVDEDCECPSTEPVACYDGPSGTLDVGACRAGTRSCAAGALGPCLGAVLPSAETCNELDDDCNGQVDDLPSLAEDAENCGRCGTVCGRGESCCAGRCVDPRGEDVMHCGACGKACSEGAMPGCCGGRCVDLLTDQTCGRCDNACGLLRLGGGFVCSCALTEREGPQCVAQMNNQEWLCQ